MKKHYLSVKQEFRLVLLTIGLMSHSAWSQSIPDVQWTRTGKTLTTTTDGNIATTEGLSEPTSSGLSKSGDQVVRYSLQGDRLSQTGFLSGGDFIGGQIQGYNYEVLGALRIAATTDGGIGVVGRTSLRGVGIATKINANGSQQGWGNGNESFPADDLTATPDGGFLVLSSANKLVYLTRFNAGHGRVWQKQLSYTASASANPDLSLTKGNAVISAPDGGYLVGGYYNAGGIDTPESGWVAKVDADGNVVWQKLLTNLPLSSGPPAGEINAMRSVTDVMVSADGAGYALVGTGILPVSNSVTALLELDLNGNLRPGRAKAIDTGASLAFITGYTGTNGKTYYAVGNASQQQTGTTPQILLVDPAVFAVTAQRTYGSPGGSFLTEIGRAGDGSLVFVTSGGQVVKLQSGGTLALSRPTYDCATGAITFNTSGGDGSLITYNAPGISRTSATSNMGTVEPGLRNDPKPLTIVATQNGQSVSYTFDFGAYCNGTPAPVTPPTGGALALLAPTYDCTTGAITFRTSGGNGSPIEYYAAPGITGWTSNPNQFVDEESRTAGDVKPFTLMARQNGVMVSYVWDLRSVCPNPPAVNPLVLLAPTYDCATGAFRFNTSGGNGTLIEYQASPGITGWTTNPNQFVDRESRTASDVKPFTLMARQSGMLVTYVWDLRAACGRARVGTAGAEAGSALTLTVLGNPATDRVRVVLGGAEGQSVQLVLSEIGGRVLESRYIERAERSEEQVFELQRSGPGLLLLRAGSGTQSKTVKILRQ